MRRVQEERLLRQAQGPPEEILPDHVPAVRYGFPVLPSKIDELVVNQHHSAPMRPTWFVAPLNDSVALSSD